MMNGVADKMSDTANMMQGVADLMAEWVMVGRPGSVSTLHPPYMEKINCFKMNVNPIRVGGLIQPVLFSNIHFSMKKWF